MTDDRQALAVGRAVLALVDAIGLGAPAASTFTAERLPDGVTRDAFLRRHRQRVRAGAEGWTRAGKARVVTAAAWAADIAAETKATVRPRLALVAAPSVDDDIDAHLGIRTKRAGGTGSR